MNLGTRAILYTARKWRKTLLLFCLLLSITTLVLSGLAISDAQEEQAEELRGTTGTSFTVSRNTATGGWGNGGNGSYSTQEYLTSDMMEKIVVDCQFYSYSCINSEYHSLFLSGALEMCDGEMLDLSFDNGIIISKEIADKHGLHVGDTIQAVNDPFSNDKTKELKIVGLFEVVADKTDERNNYNEASYYDYANNAFVSETTMKALLENYEDVGYASADFFVNDPEQLEGIIQQVQKITSINWNNFIITANDEVYERVSSSISDTGTLITTLRLGLKNLLSSCSIQSKLS